MEQLLNHWWLVPVVFFTAIMTAVTGLGGGMLLLGIMGLALPPGAVIPLHGAVMGVQNLFRGILLWKDVDWRFVGVGALGSVMGALLAGPVAVRLPETLMQIVFGLGLLYLAWMPRPEKPWLSSKLSLNVRTAIMGMLTSMLALLIGAAGGLLTAMRKRGGRAKEGLLADQSWLALLQHILKVLVFGLAGFVFGPYLLLILGMVVVGLVGTWVGVNLMRRMHEAWFDRLFKVALTLLALAMLGKAAF